MIRRSAYTTAAEVVTGEWALSDLILRRSVGLTQDALVLLRQGRRDQALARLQESWRWVLANRASQGAEAVVDDALGSRGAGEEGGESKVAVWLETLLPLCELYQGAGDYATAAPLIDELMRILRQELARDQPPTGWLLRLERLLAGEERWSEVEQVSWRILEQCRHPLRSLELCYDLARLARAHRELGLGSCAQAAFRHCLDVSRERQGARHEATIRTLNGLAGLQVQLGRMETAESLFEQIHSLVGEPLVAHQAARDSVSSLIQLRRCSGAYHRARDLCQSLLSLRLRMFLPEPHPEILDSLRELASIAVHQGQLEEARRCTDELLRMCAGERQPLPTVAQACAQMAWVLSRMGRLVEAEKLLWDALALERRYFGMSHPRVTWILESLAEIAAVDQREKAARRRWRLATRLDRHWIRGLSWGCFARDRTILNRFWQCKIDRGLSLIWRHGPSDSAVCFQIRELALRYRRPSRWIRGRRFWKSWAGRCPDLRAALQRVRLLHAQINHLTLVGPRTRQPRQHRRLLRGWRSDVSKLWRGIESSCKSLDRRDSPKPIEAIEFHRFSPRDLAAPFHLVERPRTQRLVVFLERSSKLAMVDLGQIEFEAMPF